MSSLPLVPRGTPLTPVMEFTDSARKPWLAYVEGTPPARQWRFLSETVLPGRRLRFDSADQSRAVDRVPAGSPFLPESRLQVLLFDSAALPTTSSIVPPPANRWPARWARVQSAAWAVARLAELAAESVRRGLQHALSGYRALLSRSAMAHHR